MVKKEGTYLESLVVVRERGLMGTWAKFRSSCVAALHPRTAFLGSRVPLGTTLCQPGPVV